MAEVYEWLNENSLRSYPFLLNANKKANTDYVLDNGLILDLALVYTSIPSLNSFCLSTIDATGSTITFNFTNGIIFSISNTLTGIQYIRGTNNSAIVINADLLENLPTAVNTFINLYVEPSLVFEYYNDWKGVTSLGASPNYYSEETGAVYSPALPLSEQGIEYLTGDVELYAGYNFCINFDTINNLIDLEVSNSCGIPLSCTDHFIDPSNVNIDCANIVSYVNGVPPDSLGNLNIVAGPNINLVLGTALPENVYDSINTGEPINSHSLFIGLTLLPIDFCTGIPPFPSN